MYEKVNSLQQLPGNQEKYHLENYKVDESSILKGKRILFLGSSVTLGACSFEQSFVECLKRMDGICTIKEAVNGTTLVEDGLKKQSYIERLRKIDKNTSIDAFVCQCSTNDASQKKELGTISVSYEMDDFDITTICGAIEYIIAYVKKTWHCPVYFYTGTFYADELYEQMVEKLIEISKKWNISILDLWHDEDMLQIDQTLYKLYMADPIHPTRAGYVEWWYPKFKDFLNQKVKAKEF